ncbi:MAG: hypothetical protein U9Q30_03015 [Campylobacterota bacterium]|nr:hypothetical protein [Campylobacterota bacterium]
MKFIFKFFIYIIFFIYMLLIFLPKENLYYFGLEKLKSQKVELTQDNIIDNHIGLLLNSINIKYEGIDISNIDKINLSTYLFSSSLNIDNIKVDSSFNKFAPESIKFIKVNHSIIDPTNIIIKSEFKLGRCDGVINLLTRTIKLNLVVSNKFKSKYRYIVKLLKKDKSKKSTKEEYYNYEYKF